jgi:hypothetical protein
MPSRWKRVLACAPCCCYVYYCAAHCCTAALQGQDYMGSDDGVMTGIPKQFDFPCNVNHGEVHCPDGGFGKAW